MENVDDSFYRSIFNACIKMFFDDSTINTFSFAASHSCCCRWMTGNTEIICDGV